MKNSIVPIYDEIREYLVLGKLMAAYGRVQYGIQPDYDAVSYVMDNLEESDFYIPNNRLIFAAMKNLYDNRQTINLLTLKDVLKAGGNYEAAGGDLYIDELGNQYTTYEIRKDAQVVKEKSQERMALEAMRTAETGINSGKAVEDILEGLRSKVSEIQMSRKSTGPVRIKDYAVTAYDKIEDLHKNGGDVTGVPSGFADLDRMTAGFHPGELIIVGARPAMGKSAFGLNIVHHAAKDKKKVCVVFSLEMSWEQVTNRLWSADAMVDAGKMRTGKLDDEDWENLAESWGPLFESPIYIDDTPGITVSQIAAYCRKVKETEGLDLILVDYLQLINGSNRESRQLEISEISRNLKALAKDMECPVIALSQLGRGVESREDKRPMLSDLRESGAIEQDADLVIFLYRDEYYNPETRDKGVAEAIISKQRNGSTGTVKLAFLGQYTKFANLGREH